MPEQSRVRRLSSGQRTAVGISVTLGLALAGYGMAGSYETVSDLARREWVPLPGLVPVGIDGGLVGVVVFDLVFTWTGQPLGWLRQLVRLLTIVTVVANAAAGWPDPIAVGLHAAAPLMLLTMGRSGPGCAAAAGRRAQRDVSGSDPVGALGAGAVADLAAVAAHGAVEHQ